MDPEPWPVAGVSALLSGLDPCLRRLNAGSAPLNGGSAKPASASHSIFLSLAIRHPPRSILFREPVPTCSPTLTDMAGTWTRLAVEAEQAGKIRRNPPQIIDANAAQVRLVK